MVCRPYVFYMNIGILTLPFHTNYGGLLQAYALQTVLERMGHNIQVFDKKRKPEVYIPIMVYFKRWVLKYLLFKMVEPIGQLEDYKHRKKRNTNTWKFADKYINRLELDNIESICKDDFDAIVVGSDQVWRKEYILNSFKCIDDAFLGFTQDWNVKRIAYAPSFGHDVWDYSEEETARIHKLLLDFDSVSVREKSAVEMCKRELGIEAVQMVDPTMLLTADDYRILTKNARKSDGNLMCYVLDMSEEKQSEINNIAEKNNLKPFTVGANVEAEWGTDRASVQPPVEEWLQGFIDAELVITDSFHACVFSIIFNKEFIFLGNSSRGNARIESLLHTFGNKPGEERLSKLNALRAEGLNYLSRALCQK